MEKMKKCDICKRASESIWGFVMNSLDIVQFVLVFILIFTD